jgi:hypothetical protein
MEFTDKTLKQIEWFGMTGYSFTRVAHELNTTPDELRKERLKNEKLDNALRRYEFNTESYFVDRMMETVISQNKELFAETYVALYRYLKEKTGTF